jgi:hypothetical protein
LKFFFDNCVSPNLVEALRCLDPRHDLTYLRKKFDPDTPDPVWIRSLAAEGGWIIVSGDPRISRGQAERAAWIESRLTAFFCGDAWGSRKLMTQASEMMRWWDDIVDYSKKAAPGSGYLLEFKTKQPTQIYPERSRRNPKR